MQLMDRLVDFLMDNISNLTSARSIKNAFSSVQEKVNHVTISSYLQYLCNAFAFYKIRRYDIKGKKYLSSNDKYYLSDHTFRYAKLGTKNMDYWRILLPLNCCDEVTRSLLESFTKKKLILLPSSAMRRFISKFPIISAMKRLLNERSPLYYRSGMLIPKW